jgi:hypothetical protein
MEVGPQRLCKLNFLEETRRPWSHGPTSPALRLREYNVCRCFSFLRESCHRSYPPLAAIFLCTFAHLTAPIHSIGVCIVSLVNLVCLSRLRCVYVLRELAGAVAGKSRRASPRKLVRRAERDRAAAASFSWSGRRRGVRVAL